MRMMRIIATGYIAMAVTQVLSGVMRGAGDTMTPMWISLFTTVILRVPVAYVWAFLTRSPELPSGSSDALFFSLLISWVMGAVVTTFFFQRGKWRTRVPSPATQPRTQKPDRIPSSFTKGAEDAHRIFRPSCKPENHSLGEWFRGSLLAMMTTKTPFVTAVKYQRHVF